MLETWQAHLAAKLTLKYPRADIIGALIFAVALPKKAAGCRIAGGVETTQDRRL
tara:strand:+ start:75 stop:236 length:162 start_codon:yes stop_codon:yes gene_type:complete